MSGAILTVVTSPASPISSAISGRLGDDIDLGHAARDAVELANTAHGAGVMNPARLSRRMIRVGKARSVRWASRCAGSGPGRRSARCGTRVGGVQDWGEVLTDRVQVITTPVGEREVEPGTDKVLRSGSGLDGELVQGSLRPVHGDIQVIGTPHPSLLPVVLVVLRTVIHI
jgi:hypothetical protein